MSKYLIKPIARIYLDPINGVYDLKRDLLLYDKVGMLNMDTLLGGLNQYKKNPIYQTALSEVEYLVRNDMFVELKSLIKEGDISLNDDENGLAAYTMELKNKMNDSHELDDKKKAELYFQHDELNTRLWCSITNASNPSVYTIPSLRNYSTFELPKTTKEKAYCIIHKLLPLPSDDTPWEKIFDFKNDSESTLKLLALKNWINELPSAVRQDELEDKIKYLANQYAESLKRHKIETRVSTIKSIVTTLPNAITELVRLKFDKAVGAFFSITEQNVNFQKYKEKSTLTGNELAYISHANTSLKKK